MTFLEAYNTIPANGWLTESEAKLLWEVAIECGGPILEVGSYQGRSTVLLALTGWPVFAVDPFDNFSDISGDEVEAILMRNLSDRGLTNVTVYRESIEDWDPQSVSLAYLDGEHTFSGTVDQIEKALQCSPRIIAVHDVNDSGGGLEVKRAAVELLGQWTDRAGRLAVWEGI